MRIRRSSGSRCTAGVVVVAGILFVTGTCRAQAPVEYQFSGQVISLNAGSTVFPGISVGSAVEGWFTIDYAAPDGDPNTNAGSYSSAQVGFGGVIGGSGFGSVANPGNQVRVVNGVEGMPGVTDDWTILQVVPGGGLVGLSLTFHDSAGQAINGEALPESAPAFSGFPELVLFARDGTGSFGQYTLDVVITPVPEPSVTVLSGLGLVLLAGFHLLRRPAVGMAHRMWTTGGRLCRDSERRADRCAGWDC